MRRILMIIGFLAIAAAAAGTSEASPGQYVRLTGPVDGSFVRGTATVTWVSNFAAATPIKIEAAPNGSDYQLVTVAVIGASQASWDTGSWSDSKTYSVRIRLLTEPAGSVVSGVTVDNTAPDITRAGRTAPNADGWNKANVVVTWNCADEVSGIDPVASVPSVTVSAEGRGLGATGTCVDRSGNVSRDTVTGINIDKTAPVITFVSRTPPANGAGWNKEDVTVTWSCADTLSGVRAAARSKTVTTQGENLSATETCTDLADNTASDTQNAISIDKVAPGIAFVSAVPLPNAAGWNKENVTLTWHCTDALSTVVQDPITETITDEGAALSKTGTCTDKAGNSTSDTHGGVKIDKADPVIALVSRTEANTNGWNKDDVTVVWGCTDTLSGEKAPTVSRIVTAEAENQSATGICSDLADNTKSDTQTGISIDKTVPTATVAPDRAPNPAGWYKASLTVTWTGTDSLSGNDTCSTPAVYTGPDTETGSLSGTCTDKAGNESAPASYAFKYDATRPDITRTSRTPANGFGWNNTDVAVTWSCSDATSGPVAPGDTKTITGEGDNLSATGNCTDLADNSSSDTQGAKIDRTIPTASASADRAPNGAGWYNASPTVTWSGTDPLSGIDSCAAPVIYSTPDTASGSLSGTCTDKAGNVSAPASYDFKYDATKPIIALVSRTPAANGSGWNKEDVTVTWTCSDALSGPVAPGDTKVLTTEGSDLSSTGTCTDTAGNSNSDTQSGIKIDKTAPTISDVTRTPAANVKGWNNTDVTVAWNCADGLSGPVAPSPIVVATEGKDQSIAIGCSDVAGNTTSDTVTVSIDKTKPVATVADDPRPNAAGWHGAPFTITWSGTDSLSGVDACSPVVAYAGPETAGDQRSGTCTDNAGNVSDAALLPFKYDSTAPTITFTSRTPANADGWNKGDVTVTWTCADPAPPGSGPVKPTVSTTVTSEGRAQTASNTCSDVADNSASDTQGGINIDKTLPVVTLIDRRPAPNDEGWNNTDVTATWRCDDPLSGPRTPTTSATVSAEGADQSAVSSCTDLADNTAPATQGSISIDKTEPVIAFLSRTPSNADGWNKADVVVTWSCTDALSQPVAATVSVTVTGEGDTLEATGTCTDKAGNTKSDTVTGIMIDRTAPTALLFGPVVVKIVGVNANVAGLVADALSLPDDTIRVTAVNSLGVVFPREVIDQYGDTKGDNPRAFTVKMRDLPAGIYMVTVEATDIAGNAGTGVTQVIIR